MTKGFDVVGEESVNEGVGSFAELLSFLEVMGLGESELERVKKVSERVSE